MSSEEIEDVVSSVRRLVSSELSPRRTSRDLGADRLLLTPSLRVVSESVPLAPPAPKAVDTPLPDPSLSDAAEAAPDDAVELIEAEWEDEIWVEPDQSPLGEVALGAEEAELLVIADDTPATADRPTGWSFEDKAPGDELQGDSAAGSGLATTVHVRPDTIEAAAAGSGHDTAEMSRPPEADVEGAIDTLAPSARVPADIIDADGTPLAVLDEAALQDIVRQMIREELQGDLGERITRNVRKLVRAEINRALVARDLD